MKKIVLKFGTASLMSKRSNSILSSTIFRDVGNQVAKLKKKGFNVVIVSSGAVQAGKEVLSFLSPEIKERLNQKEIAGIGNRHLLNRWGEALRPSGMEVCQMLITHENWKNIRERNNIKKGILDCANSSIVPVINENDIVSDEEIRWMEEGISENDKLAQMVAILIKADAMLFLTASEGVYNKDPKEEGALLLPKIDGLNPPKIFEKSLNGSGGMEVKIKAATECLKGGVERVAISGVHSNKKTILNFAEGKNVGTEVTLY